MKVLRSIRAFGKGLPTGGPRHAKLAHQRRRAPKKVSLLHDEAHDALDVRDELLVILVLDPPLLCEVVDFDESPLVELFVHRTLPMLHAQQLLDIHGAALV
eukprot:4646025-Pyramimonas_sp.AAC.1